MSNSKLYIDSRDTLTVGEHTFLVLEKGDGTYTTLGGYNGADLLDWILGGGLLVAKYDFDAEDGKSDVKDFAKHDNSKMLDLGGRDAEDVWDIIKQQAAFIDGAISYKLNDQTCNAFMTSLLKSVGLFSDSNIPNSGSRQPGNWQYSWWGWGADTLDHVRVSLKGTDAVDWIYGANGEDYLEGNKGNDIIGGGKGGDYLVGGAGDDRIDGGDGDDLAKFSGKFTDYIISKNSSDVVVQDKRGDDGTDTLINVESGYFSDRCVLFDLVDGARHTNSVDILDSGGGQHGKVNVTLPTSMLDGDVDIEINLSSSGLTKKYNFALVIDVSGSMSGQQLKDAKNAYIDLINHLESLGIAQDSTFAVIPFDSSATLHGPLSSTDAKSVISAQVSLGTTNFTDALTKTNEYFNNTTAYNYTNIAYFMSDGEPNDGGDYTKVANLVQKQADVRAYGIGNADLSTLNIVDSNDADLLKSASELTAAFTSSSLKKSDIAGIDIYLGNTLVRSVLASDLTEDTLGLSYTGTIDGLDVSVLARNQISVKTRFTDQTWSAAPVESDVAAYDFALRRRARGFDFDGDGVDDVLLQALTGPGSTIKGPVNPAAAASGPTPGTIAIWTMDDTAIKVGSVAKVLNDPSWLAVGSSDFDGDGKSDVLLRHQDGRVAVWTMNGASLQNGAIVKTLSDTNWQVATLGDFDGDGSGDVMLKHTDGRIALWHFADGQLSRGSVVKTLADGQWRVVGSGDFDGNGREDVLFQHDGGQVARWSMDGDTIASATIVTTLNDVGWRIEGAGDFNGDGLDDALLKHSDGSMKFWRTRVDGGFDEVSIGKLSDTSWNVAAIGDYNGDGRDDIIFQSADGRVGTWLMDDGTRLHAALTKTFTTSNWAVIGDGGVY